MLSFMKKVDCKLHVEVVVLLGGIVEMVVLVVGLVLLDLQALDHLQEMVVNLSLQDN